MREFAENKNIEILPTLDEILKGEVVARWYVPVSKQDDDASQNSAGQYTFSLSQNNFGEYAFTPPSLDSSSAENQISRTSNDSSSSKTVECQLCPKHCRIKDGNVGFCSSRINRSGRLLARFYGRPTSIAVDPIEKKPLFHFLPGTRILSLGTQGCNLSCKFCQNWQISRPFSAEATIERILEPQQVVTLALKNNCPSVAFTYNEPSIWAEYVIDTARLCRKNGIRTVIVTNGMISGQARKETYREIDAANVDLKSFTSHFYKTLVGGSLDDVKETLEYIVKETDVWLEITNLLIPSKNDSSEEIEKLCQWIVETLGREIPLHFSAFFPTWRLTDLQPTPAHTLQRAAKIARTTGLSYVYCGNVTNSEFQKTFCPQCSAVLIEREKYSVRISSMLEPNPHLRLQEAEDKTSVSSSAKYCQNCGLKIAGVYSS